MSGFVTYVATKVNYLHDELCSTAAWHRLNTGPLWRPRDS
jgi:hypothetical protein